MLRYSLPFLFAVALLCPGQGKDPKKQCDDAAFHSLDFLLGDWEVRNPQGQLMGWGRFESRTHGCAMVEHWRGVRGGQGTGLMFWDPDARAWTRVYVAPGFLENGFNGKPVENGVEFNGAVPEQGKTLHMRVRYEHTADGPRIVDQESADGGKTWSAAVIKTFRKAAQPPDFKLTADAAAPCQAPEFRQFDFWAGQWNVTAGGKPAGTNRIDIASRGCLLIENWANVQGVEGMSFNYFDPASGLWNQRWVAPGGALALTGKFADGAMTLAGGTEPRNEIAWTRAAGGAVRQLWRSSTDGGKSWKPAFDGLYSPAAPPR